MRLILLIGSAFVCLFLIAMKSADACPDGTVFSAYKKNGICAYLGQGAKVAVQCTIADGKCPSGNSRERKNSSKNTFCCPTTIANEQSKTCVWRGTAPFCEGRCGSSEQFRGSVRDKISAERVYSTKAWSNTFGKDCVSGSKALCCHYNG